MNDNVKLNDNDTIAITSFAYLQTMNELLESTPKRTIVNFIIMRIIDYHYPSITGEFTYYEKNSNRWTDQCKSFVKEKLSVLVNSIYIRKYFNVETKTLVLEMVEGIREEFKKLLSSSSWMDEKTLEMALKKLNNIEALIAFPDELLDDEILIMHHENLTIDDEKFFESVLSLEKFTKYHQFKNIHSEIMKSDWEYNSDLLIINAFYSPIDNNISKIKLFLNSLIFFYFLVIPAPFLQGDFFKLSRAKYFNIASLGYIIGHEM